MASKLRVNQLEDLAGTNTVNVSDLFTDSGSKEISTSTGTQTVSEALDSRVIYVDTVAELQALDASGLVDGQLAEVTSSGLFRWASSGQEWVPAPSPIVYANQYDSLEDAIATGRSVYVPDDGTEYEVPLGTNTSEVRGPGVISSGGNSFIADRPYGTWATGVGRYSQELSVGFPNYIFDDAHRAPQGLAFIDSGGPKLFLKQRSGGDSYTEQEVNRIVEYDFLDNGNSVTHNSFSDNIHTSGHQGLSAVEVGGQVYLYSAFPVEPGTSGYTNTGKGFSKIAWNGSSTDDSDVELFQLFGYKGSGHKYERYAGATPSVSPDGKWIALVVSDTVTDSGLAVLVYDLPAIEAMPDTLDAEPSYKFKLPPITEVDAHQYQDVACDGKYIYTYNGFVNPLYKHQVRKFDFNGNHIATVFHDGIRGYYGYDDMWSGTNPLECPRSMEPEGIAIAGDKLLLLSTNNWREFGDIVTYDGLNFACLSDGSGNPPSYSSTDWVRTNKPSNSGEWDSGTNYVTGNRTLYSKAVVSLEQSKGGSDEFPLDSGITLETSSAHLVTGNARVDVSYPEHQRFSINSFSQNTESHRNAMSVGGSQIRLHDPRYGSDNSKYVSMYSVFEPNTEQLQLRAGVNISDGAGLTLYGNGDDAGGLVKLYTGGKTSLKINDYGTRAVRPGGDNEQNLGTGGNRWKDIFASSGTVSTSDEREKQQVKSLNDAEKSVAASLKALVKRYKWNHAVEKKGKDARLHVGWIAQDVIESFSKEGLDAHDYGMLCYDEWDDEYDDDGSLINPAGNRYGLRHDQVLAFILSEL